MSETTTTEKLLLYLPPEDVERLTTKESKAFHDDLRRGWHAKAMTAAHRQLQAAQTFERVGIKHHPILGQLTMVVDPVLYEEARRLHGADCWRDPEFRRQIRRDNRVMNIKSRSGKTTILRP